jgi:hypothetical protein
MTMGGSPGPQRAFTMSIDTGAHVTWGASLLYGYPILRRSVIGKCQADF